jgi:hypothetical protein
MILAQLIVGLALILLLSGCESIAMALSFMAVCPKGC